MVEAIKEKENGCYEQGEITFLMDRRITDRAMSGKSSLRKYV